MLISTGVDALIKLVKEKKKIEITLASRLLNIPISTIEEWAHALESEGILSIEYQLTKVYLKWITPTEEKINEERVALQTEKTQLMEQIKELEVKSKNQIDSVAKLKDEFNANYSKLLMKLEELAKNSGAVQETKAARESDYYKAVDQLEEVRGQISQVRDSIQFMREQLEKTKTELMSSELEKKVAGIVNSRERVAALKSELESMESEVAKIIQSISSKNIDSSGFKQGLESLRSEFSSLTKQIEEQRELLKEVRSFSQLMENAKKEIEDMRASSRAVVSELKDFKGTVSEISNKAAQASKVIAENEERAARLEESLKNAEETFSHLNLDKNQEEAMMRLSEDVKKLSERMDKFQSENQTILPLFENVDKVISGLSELKKKVGEERKRLAEESGAIFASLDEEIATYGTFQKIKERAISTINDYLNQLEKIEVNYENAANLAEKVEKKLDEALAKFKESSEYKDAEELSTLMDKLAEKKQLLEEIRSGLENLDESAKRTAKQINILSKEVQLLEIRAGSTAPEMREQVKRAEDEIKESISLTESEQQEFDSKREELRKLIKKLWEEE